ncbi:hypothetical protein [Sphingomonas sp. NBWT7]|nr:hypothetical protein [Sphingomonas sp. NBWT7]
MTRESCSFEAKQKRAASVGAPLPTLRRMADRAGQVKPGARFASFGVVLR